MSTVATKLMTAEEFYDFVHRPENSDRCFELVKGKVIEMPPPGLLHGFVCANVAFVLQTYARQRRHGFICTNDAGVILERGPDTVRGPDVSFYDDDQTADTMERKYAEQHPPILAVEVLSPSDTALRVNRKVDEMVRQGITMVWVVDPELREVGVYRLGQPTRLIEGDGELTGDDVLPDFTCRVSEFFRVPGQP